MKSKSCNVDDALPLRDNFPPVFYSQSVLGASQVVLAGFPGSSAEKESGCNAGDPGSIPGLGRSPGGGHGNPLQYSCLENPHGQRSLVDYSLWNSPGQNTGVGSLSLMQGIFPTQESNQGLLHCRWILYQLSYQENPRPPLINLQNEDAEIGRAHV